jgi:hypothetical protein
MSSALSLVSTLHRKPGLVGVTQALLHKNIVTKINALIQNVSDEYWFDSEEVT